MSRVSRVSEAEGTARGMEINFQDVTWCDTLHRDVSGRYMMPNPGIFSKSLRG